MMQPTILYREPTRPQNSSSGQKRRRTALTERDCLLFETLLTSVPYLTSQQLQRLFWRNGGEKACLRRLKQLTDAGYLRRYEVPLKKGLGSYPYVYALARKGQRIVVDHLGVDPADYPLPDKGMENYPFLTHLLDTISVQIATLYACAGMGLHLVEWLHESMLRRRNMLDKVELATSHGTSEPVSIVPDSYFVLARNRQTSKYFLELDRSTVVVLPSTREKQSWAKKVRAYAAYFDSDPCRVRYGSAHQLRVLVLCKTAQRLQSLRDATIAVTAGGDQRFWFGLLADALAENDGIPQLLTAPLWQIADERFGKKERYKDGEDPFQRFSLLAY